MEPMSASGRNQSAGSRIILIVGSEDRDSFAESDPIVELTNRIGDLVEYFGPDAKNTIREAMEQDRHNAKRLANMERDLRTNGDYVTAARIVKHTHNIADHALSQVIPMRRHIKEIAELLSELIDPETLQSPTVVAEIMKEIEGSAEKAFASAAKGKQYITDLAVDLRSIQGEYSEKVRHYQAEVDKSGKEAEQHAQNAVLHGSVGVGGFAMVNSASAVAQLPLVGPFLITSITTPTSWIWGWLGYTTTTYALNPAGVVFGAGFTVFAALLVSSCYRAHQERQSAKASTRRAEEAKQQKEKSQLLADETKDVYELIAGVVETADLHLGMWQGIRFSAGKAAESFKALQKMDPTGPRRRIHDKRMKAFAHELFLSVKAIDEYLFMLSKTSYFPPNYDIRHLIGKEAYARMETSLHEASDLPGQLAISLPSASSPS